MRKKRVMLVYQAGLANVFEVDSFNLAEYGRNARRIYQGDFKSCYMLASGMGHAGCIVRSAHCNLPGDIADAAWSEAWHEAPFSPIPLHLN